MIFYIADAFSENLFGGNPAGVVMIPADSDFPEEEIMKKVAAELRYSETAFVKELEPRRYRVRYFTPVAEVDLCGHATIATFGCIANESGSYIAETLAGEIGIEVMFDEQPETKEQQETSKPHPSKNIVMGMATPRHITTITDAIEVDRLYEIMGSEFDQSIGLFPMIVSTGLPDIILPVASREELNNLAPDMDALSRLSKNYGVTGVHAFAFGNGDEEFFARNFAPLYGIDEEAATGTANGALAYYLYINQKIQPGARCRVIQGEKMGRPSEIMVFLDEDISIRVGGKVAILAEGSLQIPDHNVHPLL